MMEYFLLGVKTFAPEIVIFLSVAIGFGIGKIRFGPIQLGGVCGTLIAALAIGQFGFVIDPGVKNFFFVLFIFALGYSGGPQFFANLTKDGLKIGVLSVIEVICAAGIALAAAKLFNFDAGTTAGLVAGSATESAVIGTATGAIEQLSLPAEQIKTLQANVVTAYSITYIFGLIAIVVFTSQIAPPLLRVNLRDEARKLWMAIGGEAEEADVNEVPEGRYYRVDLGAGKLVKDVLKALGPSVRLQRLLRKQHEVLVEPETRLHRGDRALLIGPASSLMRAESMFGSEYAGTHTLNSVMGTDEYILTNQTIAGKTVGDLRAIIRRSGEGAGFPIFAGMSRNGEEMPVLRGLRLASGDIIRLYGEPVKVAEVGALFGKKIPRGDQTNIILAAFGIILGIAIGSVGAHLGGVYFSLGTGGGALLAGLVFGWFQARHPVLPGIPPAATEMMKDLGLATFIACVGISAGPEAFTLIIKYGVVLPLVGLTIALTPAIVSLVVGHRFLRLEVPILLGGIAGQQCSTPALSAVQSAAGNTTPLLGYTITYAISNVLLPFLGPVVVGITAT